MYVIYVDECGYHLDWAEEKAIKAQPVYVVSAVAIPSESVHSVYEKIRDSISQIELPGIDANALGKEQEIKAKEVDRGKGFWGKNQELRDEVRQIFLDRSPATYFVVCIDKARHSEKYAVPQDPAILGLQFLLERVQGFLQEQSKQGFVIIDTNKRLEAHQRERLGELHREGSRGTSFSKFYGIHYEWHLKMENIIEIHFGDSKHSLGLQIADFVARHTYSWWKSGKNQDYPGWSFILPRLWKYPNHDGYGYKEFPEE
jgi:hypothetical protein